MKVLNKLMVWPLVFQLTGVPALLAQPVIIQPGNPFGNQQLLGSGIENLRVSQQSPDGTEVQLTMDYTYDGFGGPSAQVLPVIGKRGQQGVSAWFGADPVTVGRGRGTITLRIKYFNDEPGVPPTFTSDQVRILILNQAGTAVLTAVPFLKNIKWGSPNARPQPAQSAAPTLALVDRASAEKLAQEKREAEAKARLEAEAREKTRLRAEAEVQARKESEAKARAEALARDEALRKAEAERLAQEKRQAEEQRLALELARAQEQKRLAAEERARQEAKALADAKARDEAKKRAEAEAQRLENERKLAEAKRLAEEKVLAEARAKAEAESHRLAEEKRAAEEKALAEAKARKEAEDRLYQEAVAQAKAELEAKKLAEEKKKAESLAQATARSPVPASRPALNTELARDKKTKITNVDVVNRSLDRTQMTFGVEFEYRDRLDHPQVGIDVLRQSQPDVSAYFASTPADIGRSRRNFALLPVKFQPSANVTDQGDFSTDEVLVYLREKNSAERYNIYPATMLLRWRAAGAQKFVAPSSGNLVEIEDFKQNDPSNGSVTVKYRLLAGQGKIHTKIYEQARPQSASYFTSNLPEVTQGDGVKVIDVRIDSDTPTPSDLVRADTIEIELIDGAGQVIARASRQAAMVWVRPK